MVEPDRIIRCPICAKSVRLHASNTWRPFCSERCQLIDLGAWAAGERRIPGEPAQDEASSRDPETPD
ncbi:MAG: DNA gyrase inhibitor YacG [Gammaproteobacteria bacterium]|nr:DNA gyrase inhibitor YacG [Gammaproteobacteria bacterium]